MLSLRWLLVVLACVAALTPLLVQQTNAAAERNDTALHGKTIGGTDVTLGGAAQGADAADVELSAAVLDRQIPRET